MHESATKWERPLKCFKLSFADEADCYRFAMNKNAMVEFGQPYDLIIICYGFFSKAFEFAGIVSATS